MIFDPECVHHAGIDFNVGFIGGDIEMLVTCRQS